MPVFVSPGALFGAAEQSSGDQVEPPARAGSHSHQKVPRAPFRSLHQQPQTPVRQPYGREGKAWHWAEEHAGHGGRL